MMGISDPQPSMFYHINLEQVRDRRSPDAEIRPLIDTARLRQLCEPLYSEVGRPSIPPSSCLWPFSVAICWVSPRSGRWSAS